MRESSREPSGVAFGLRSRSLLALVVLAALALCASAAQHGHDHDHGPDHSHAESEAHVHGAGDHVHGAGGHVHDGTQLVDHSHDLDPGEPLEIALSDASWSPRATPRTASPVATTPAAPASATSCRTAPLAARAPPPPPGRRALETIVLLI